MKCSGVQRHHRIDPTLRKQPLKALQDSREFDFFKILSVNFSFLFYYCFKLFLRTQKNWIWRDDISLLLQCEKHLVDENAAGYDFLVDFHHTEGTKSSDVDDLTTIVQVVAYCVRNVLTFPRAIVVLREEDSHNEFLEPLALNVLQPKLLTFGISFLVPLIERLVGRFMIS